MSRGVKDDAPVSLTLCENCGKPARFIYTLDNGAESAACTDPCVPAAGVAARPVGTEPAKAEPVPLTVEQAADRERVSTRTIRRWLPELETSGGAWRVGAQWRINPDALDARRSTPRPAKTPTKRPRRRRAATAPAADGGWPT
jgi:excisionase family DNA binding protein